MEMENTMLLMLVREFIQKSYEQNKIKRLVQKWKWKIQCSYITLVREFIQKSYYLV